MRTTLTLDDDLLQRLRQKAASENRAFKQVVNDVLRAGLALDREAPAYTFRLTTAEGRVMPGVDLTDRDKLFDLMDGRQVIGLDTNILVFAHRAGTTHHGRAIDLLERLSTGRTPYGLFWPSLYEFLRVVTHHRVFDPPSTIQQAVQAVADFLRPPVAMVLRETAAHAGILADVLRDTPVTGNLVHDAHLVALAIEHGVHEILTLDGDFRRFPQVASRNPFA